MVEFARPVVLCVLVFGVQTICVKTDGYAKYDGYNGQDYQDRPWNVRLPLTTKWMRALRRGTWNVYRRAKTRRIEQFVNQIACATAGKRAREKL